MITILFHFNTKSLEMTINITTNKSFNLTEAVILYYYTKNEISMIIVEVKTRK